MQRKRLAVWAMACVSLAGSLTLSVLGAKGTAQTGGPSVDQVPLDPLAIPKFEHELPIPRVYAPRLIRDSRGQVVRHEYTVSVAQTRVQMLPPGFASTTV
jgi:hypothetical protein